jgi:putative intracellular protease/amidase
VTKKIAIIVTNTEKYPQLDRKTGLWLGEVTHFCDEIEQAGISFDLISPHGGVCPLDPKSLSSDRTNAKYMSKAGFVKQLKETLAAKDAKANDYAAIYFSGGHGTMFDFPDSKDLQSLTANIFAKGGIVSAVCHGVCGLLNVKVGDGRYLIEGKPVTGFSNLEEGILRLKKHVPFLLESEIVKRSGQYRRAFLPFMPYIVESQSLITGQNPASARKLGKAVAAKLLRT